jgi:tRNA modification GTPase
MAKAGEFTLRAFINGRIDLSQAEAIADVIASENEASRKVAINQLKGGITNEISLLRTDLLNFVSLIELELDFAEEDVEFADRTALSGLLDKIDVKLNLLLKVSNTEMPLKMELRLLSLENLMQENLPF